MSIFRKLLLPLLLILCVPALVVAIWMYVSGSGVLSQKIPGASAANQPNVTCVYFFMRGFHNEATTEPQNCPRQISLKDLHA